MVPEEELHSKLLICVLKRQHVIVHFGSFRGWLAGLFSNKNSREQRSCGRDQEFLKQRGSFGSSFMAVGKARPFRVY